ncbi:MAG: cytidylate kinase family protein [Candidatus Micrarchaeia archaeon]
MKIAISGLTGAGKTTIAGIISKKLKVPNIAFSMKDEAKARGISLLKFQEMAAKDKRFDIELDRKQIAEMKKHKSFVTSTWLAPWFANADLNVWLYANEKIRAERVAKRDNISIYSARKIVHKKDQQNRERYIKLYRINIDDINRFHICINTEHIEPEKAAKIIIEAAKVVR